MSEQTTASSSAPAAPAVPKTDPFFSKNYASKAGDAAKEGLIFGVRIAAVAAPILLVSGLINWATRRD